DIVAEYESEGMPAGWTNKFREAMIPAVETALQRQQTKAVTEARESLLSHLGDRALDSADADEIRDIMAEARASVPTASELDIVRHIGLRAVEAAAEAGDTDRFNAAAEALDGRLSDRVAAYRLRMNAAKRAAQHRRTELGAQVVLG